MPPSRTSTPTSAMVPLSESSDRRGQEFPIPLLGAMARYRALRRRLYREWLHWAKLICPGANGCGCAPPLEDYQRLGLGCEDASCFRVAEAKGWKAVCREAAGSPCPCDLPTRVLRSYRPGVRARSSWPCHPEQSINGYKPD
jgi:hypothetical protein